MLKNIPTAVQGEAERPTRLEAVREVSLYPWTKSYEQTGCHLYWTPFSMPKNSPRQREWVIAFAERLEAELAKLSKAEPAFFLQLKVINDYLSQPFYTRIREISPIMGLSRRPGAPLPAAPDQKYIEGLQTGKIKYDHQALQPDYCYHFLFQDMKLCMSQFFGVGGSSTFFFPADERTRPMPPPVPLAIKNDPSFAPLLAFARVDDMMGALHRMTSPVFPRSRLTFGRGLEDNLHARGVTFIMPLLSVEAFQQATSADLQEWFELFDAVLVESPTDKGLLLASKFDLDTVLNHISSELKYEQQLEYPLYA